MTRTSAAMLAASASLAILLSGCAGSQPQAQSPSASAVSPSAAAEPLDSASPDDLSAEGAAAVVSELLSGMYQRNDYDAYLAVVSKHLGAEAATAFDDTLDVSDYVAALDEDAATAYADDAIAAVPVLARVYTAGMTPAERAEVVSTVAANVVSVQYMVSYSQATYEVSVDPAAVTVDGDTARIDGSGMTVTSSQGESNTGTAGTTVYTLRAVDGSWRIVVELQK